MSPSIAAWLGSGGGLPTSVAQQRAALAWRRITDKPTKVVFRTRARVALAEQTVRLEYDDAVREVVSAAGQAPVRGLVIFGIRNHATLPDTDIQEGYTFNVGGDSYRVIDINTRLIGEVQAHAEAGG
jgi:hypothetical protein